MAYCTRQTEDMKLHVRFLCFCCLFIAQSVTAIEVGSLFTASVTAQSQSSEDRNSAISEALQVVISRLTTDKEFAQNPVVKSALDDAASYVDQYRYVQGSNNNGKSSLRILLVTFNKDTLMSMMRSSGLAVWGANREKILLWLVIEQGEKQVLLDVDQDDEIEAALQRAVYEKGIPLLLPLMDLEEKQAISVKDILANNSNTITTVSARYDVATVLSGKLIKRRTCWRSEWALHINNNVEKWTEPCADLKTNLSAAMQKVYLHLASVYAQKSE